MANDKNFKVKEGLDVGGNINLNTDVNPTITIKNTDTTIIADQAITTLEFRGADDSGNVLAGQIQQVASGEWGVADYGSDMIFSVKQGGTFGAFAEKLRLQYGGVGVSGNLALNTDVNPTITIKNTDTSIIADQVIGTLEFRGADDSGNVLAGQIQQVASYTWGIGSYNSDMVFSTKTGGTGGPFTEKLRLQVDGVGVSGDLAVSGGTTGTTADFSSSVEANNFNVVGGAFIARNPGNVDGSLWLASSASGTTSANGVTIAGGTSAYSYHNSSGINIKQGGLLIDDVEVINAYGQLTAAGGALTGGLALNTELNPTLRLKTTDTTITTDQVISTIEFIGAIGVGSTTAGHIQQVATEDWAAGAVGSDMVFSINTGSSFDEKLRLQVDWGRCIR